MSRETALDIRNLRVWYGTEGDPVRAVDGVSLEVARGETVGVVGESGCGKSTLGRAIAGLLPASCATSGTVRVAGTEIVRLPPRDMRKVRGAGVGLIFQEPMTRLNPLLRIRDHFREVLEAHEPGLSRSEIRQRSLDALAAVSVPRSRFDQYPHELSGGMRQRIMIALAVALRPRVLVADEPTTSLDVIVEAQIVRLLAELCSTFDTALVFITHNLAIVSEICSRVAVMYAGKIVETGPSEAVFSRPEHPYTRALLASTISLDTESLHSIDGSPPSLVDPPSGCRFHPRCPHAMNVCAAQAPPEAIVDADRRVACWLPVDVGDDPAERALRAPLESRLAVHE